MDPFTISAILSAVPAVGKAITGVGQLIKGKKLGQTPRPVYETPGEIQKLISTAQTRAASTKMAGQERMEEKIGASTANVMAKAKDVADPMAYLQTVSGAAGKEQDVLGDLSIAAAEDTERRQQAAQEALALGAQYKDKEFDINKMQPYQAAQAASSALKEGGIQNVVGAATDVAGVFSSMIGTGNKQTTTGAAGNTKAGEQVASPQSGMDLSSITGNLTQAEKNKLRITNPSLYNQLFGGY